MIRQRLAAARPALALALAFAFSLGLAGCASSSTPPPAPAGSAPAVSSGAPAAPASAAPGSGFVTYSDPANGFAVDLPASWKPVKVDPAGIDAAAAALQSTNPDVAAFFQGHKDALIATGDQLYAMDLSADALSTGAAEGITAKVTTVPDGTSADDLATSVITALQSQPGVSTQISQRHVMQANGADAVELTYQIAAQGSSGQPVTSDTTTYLLLKGTRAYALTLTIRSDFAAQYASTYSAIGQSFRLLP